MEYEILQDGNCTPFRCTTCRCASRQSIRFENWLQSITRRIQNETNNYNRMSGKRENLLCKTVVRNFANRTFSYG